MRFKSLEIIFNYALLLLDDFTLADASFWWVRSFQVHERLRRCMAPFFGRRNAQNCLNDDVDTQIHVTNCFLCSYELIILFNYDFTVKQGIVVLFFRITSFSLVCGYNVSIVME